MVQYLAINKRYYFYYSYSYSAYFVLFRFVLEWCERGRGLRPDWALKGLEFLYFAANPAFTKARAQPPQATCVVADPEYFLTGDPDPVFFTDADSS